MISQTRTWSGGEICIVCHTPHNADIAVTDAPLWNHYVDTTTEYTPYFTETLDATVGQPTGISLLCLSCHDGTVAIDSFGATASGGFIDDGTHDIAERVNLGTELTNDHPISFTYDAALANDDGGLNDPTITEVIIGEGDKETTGVITDLLLIDNQLQCSSCHDVHNTLTQGDLYLLKVSNVNSGLCLTCHSK